MIRADDMLGDPGQVLTETTHRLGTYYATASTDCGCPEALFECEGYCVIAHFEEDGSGEIFAYGGEEMADQEHVCEATDLDDLIEKAVKIIS